MRILISLLFIMCLCVSAFAQKDTPEIIDNRIILTPEISPSAIPNNAAALPITTTLSFTNTNPNSNSFIQEKDAFRVIGDGRIIQAMGIDSRVIVNSSNFSSRNFQLTQNGALEFTLTYLGRPAVFAPGDTISLRLHLVPQLVTGAGNFTFEVISNSLAYNTPKQFVRLTLDLPNALNTSPVQIFRLTPSGTSCVLTIPNENNQQGLFRLPEAHLPFTVDRPSRCLVFATLAVTSNNAVVETYSIAPTIFFDGQPLQSLPPQEVTTAINGLRKNVSGNTVIFVLEPGAHTIELGGRIDRPGACFEYELIVVIF